MPIQLFEMTSKIPRILWNFTSRNLKSCRSFSYYVSNGSGASSSVQTSFGINPMLTFDSSQSHRISAAVTKHGLTLSNPLWLGPAPSYNTPNPIRMPRIGIPISHQIIPIADVLIPRNRAMGDPTNSQNIIEEAPDVTHNRVEKRAARLIVIRRAKMNKHKLKKLRKRMKHQWGRVKLRRELRKEKIFLDSQLQKIREAERFDAKEHVASLIAKAKEKQIPRRWKGKRMPGWWIKEQIALGKIKL